MKLCYSNDIPTLRSYFCIFLKLVESCATSLARFRFGDRNWGKSSGPQISPEETFEKATKTWSRNWRRPLRFGNTFCRGITWIVFLCFLCLYYFISVIINHSIYLSVCLSINLYIYLPIYPSILLIYLSIWKSINLPIYLSANLSVNLSITICICQSINQESIAVDPWAGIILVLVSSIKVKDKFISTIDWSV